METDYRNYDRLFVTVKLNKLDELEECYRALGWECVDSREHVADQTPSSPIKIGQTITAAI